MNSDQIIRKLENHRDEIREYGVERLALFGSHARDEATDDSDLDFLVEFKDGRGLFRDYCGLKNFLEELFEKEVDLVKPKLVKDKLRPYILEGKQVEAKI